MGAHERILLQRRTLWRWVNYSPNQENSRSVSERVLSKERALRCQAPLTFPASVVVPVVVQLCVVPSMCFMAIDALPIHCLRPANLFL